MATRAKFAWLAQYSCKFFSKMAFGECRLVWRVRAKQVGECRRVWRVLAKPLDECWLKQDRSFYAQITYFIWIKRSSLHSLNSPNLLNLCKTCQTCLSRVWRVLAKWFGECRWVWRVRATWLGEWRQVWRVRAAWLGECPTHFRKRPFWRVLEFAKKWQIFGEYSNSLNSLVSGHSLIQSHLTEQLNYSNLRLP